MGGTTGEGRPFTQHQQGICSLLGWSLSRPAWPFSHSLLRPLAEAYMPFWVLSEVSVWGRPAAAGGVCPCMRVCVCLCVRRRVVGTDVTLHYSGP